LASDNFASRIKHNNRQGKHVFGARCINGNQYHFHSGIMGKAGL
jgi:hypothetical protein